MRPTSAAHTFWQIKSWSMDGASIDTFRALRQVFREVCDALAETEPFIAARTLVTSFSFPLRRLIDDLTDNKWLFVGSALQPEAQ